jgi:uncharacterized repeat protein (TIGR02543 family)
MKKIKIFAVIMLLGVLLSCEYSLENIVNELTVATKFNLTYDENGADAGSAPLDFAEYQEGFNVTVMDNTGNLVKGGYNFAGWNTKEDGSGTTYTTGQILIVGKSNVVLYAKWTNNPVYRITYNGNGAASGTVPVDNTCYETGFTAVIPGNTGNLVRSGFTFNGWNTQSNGSGTSYAQGSIYTILGSNVTLYARWSAGDTYTVTYIKNGGTGSVPVDSTNYSAGNTVTVLGNVYNIVYTGYSFNGWNTADNGSGTQYSPGATFSMPADDMLLYAVWAINGYTVTFNTQGGSAVSLQIINYGNTVSVPGSPTRGGYVFDGWYKEAGCSSAWNFLYDTVTGNTTIYAKWIPVYNVTFDKNDAGASGSMSPQLITSGTSANLTGCGFTKPGSGFLGWATSSAGAVVYTDGATYTMGGGNVVLYAKWGDAVYVSPSGSSSNSGLSSASPKKSIEDGIAVAQSYGIGMVRIAAGNYTISSTITMVPGVSLQGGWDAAFSARDWTVYQTKLLSAIPLSPMFDVSNTSISGVVYEGFYVSILQMVNGTSSAFNIADNASPVIQDNNIYIINSGADSSYSYGFMLAPGAAANVVIRRNIIRLHRTNRTPAGDSARAIYFFSGGAGSNVTIEKNRITVCSNQRADGIRIAGSSANIIIRNNIISDFSTDNMALAVTIDGGSPYVKIVNNTIHSYAPLSNEYGVYFNTAGGATYIVNNIFHSQASGGFAMNVSSGTPFFLFNLTFGFGTHANNFTPDGTNSYYAAAGTFANVFTDGTIDSVLTDGDDTNYHINPADASYAYNRGMGTGSSTYGSVTYDIDGQARPIGGVYDRGADER